MPFINSEQMTENTESFETDDSSSQRKRPLLDISNYCIILFFIIILIVLALVVVIAFIGYIIKRNGKDNKPDENGKNGNLTFQPKTYWYVNEGDKSKNEYVHITQEGVYKVCVFGAKAIEGGRGGKQCATHLFKEGNFIDFHLEGRSSGGIGGKNCGSNNGDAYNGAGLALAQKRNHPEEFVIVAGGGGGSSENKINKGGDYEKDGEGTFKGGGARWATFGKKGDNDNSQDGTIGKGGNGGSNGYIGFYCGGGGGNGYYGGGGGGWASSEKRAGGGGGGSNFCKGQNCKKGINDVSEYAGYKIEKI